jgi:hypothetical protein
LSLQEVGAEWPAELPTTEKVKEGQTMRTRTTAQRDGILLGLVIVSSRCEIAIVSIHYIYVRISISVHHEPD